MGSLREANRFVGQAISICCKGNRRYKGIVREVRPEGVLLEMLPGTPAQASVESGGLGVVTADKPEEVKGQPVFWLLPLVALLGLQGFRGFGTPHWGYGMPGYGYGNRFWNGYGNGFGYGYGYGMSPYRSNGFGYPGMYW